jgi:hypothetical protein
MKISVRKWQKNQKEKQVNLKVLHDVDSLGLTYFT